MTQPKGAVEHADAPAPVRRMDSSAVAIGMRDEFEGGDAGPCTLTWREWRT